MIGDGASEIERCGVRARCMRIGIAHHVAVDVTAGGNRIEQDRIDRLQRGLQVRFDDTVELHRLPRGQPQRAVAVIARHPVERQPLRAGEDPAGNPHADHEGKRLLHLLARTLGAQIAIILQVHAVEFHQLGIVLADRAGDFLPQPVGQCSAQIIARFLDALVA